jgi:hypothetical protein
MPLEQRSYVMHYFFLDRFDVLRLTGSPETMSQELRPIWELLNNVQDRADAVLEIVQKQFEVLRTQIDQEAKQVLRIYQSPHSSMGRDSYA